MEQLHQPGLVPQMHFLQMKMSRSSFFFSAITIKCNKTLLTWDKRLTTCMSYLPFPHGIRYFCMPYCIVFLGVIEKSCKKLVLRVSSGVPNNCGLMLSSVSRCLQPLMKHSHSFLTYYLITISSIKIKVYQRSFVIDRQLFPTQRAIVEVVPLLKSTVLAVCDYRWSLSLLDFFIMTTQLAIITVKIKLGVPAFYT